MKAIVKILQNMPEFNSSLSNDGKELILKTYINIGVAVDTPNGLVVPVIKDVDKKSLKQLTIELSQLSEKARLGKLLPTEMQGGCFTISSLGGVGGTYFTPIINPPEVSILGISRMMIEPVFTNKKFVPRKMLPFSLSYDHRVIDGVTAVKFTRAFATILEDLSILT
jgi:pyruvate dehydrogenase E2 component (dihydrolipoamide acetyltransferase)